MIKYFFMSFFFFCLLSSTCFAITLTNLVEFGIISTLPPNGKFVIVGATSINGDNSKGIASFGQGNDLLYVHYDNSYFFTDDFKLNAFHSKELINSFKIGGNDVSDTIILPMTFPHTCKIYQVVNDSNLPMFLLEYDKSSVPSYKLIGIRQGKWVLYFETVAAEQYYSMKMPFCHNFKLQGDSIIFEYGHFDSVEKKFITSSELIFTWNNSDKWFGVNLSLKESLQ